MTSASRALAPRGCLPRDALPVLHAGLPLEALLADEDRVHVRDHIGVGLIDASWLARMPSALAERLADLLDNPED